VRLTAGVALVLLHFVPFRTPQKQKEPHSSNIWFLLMGGESEIDSGRCPRLTTLRSVSNSPKTKGTT